jgi:hypothetical protein
MSRHYLRRALNGTNGEVSFKEIPVYHDWMWGDSYVTLGKPLQKEEWIRQNIKEECNYKAVNNMLIDWELYENGWFVSGNRNNRLWNHLCQIGNNASSNVIETTYLK